MRRGFAPAVRGAASVGVALKPVHIALLTLALGACDAFDASRLASLQPIRQAPVRDAGSDEPDDQEPALDAAAPSDIEEPEAPPDAVGAPERDAADVVEEPEVVCDDEDGGTPEDSDGDGVLDCADACPFDPAKISAGLCGCSHPDNDGDGVVSCRGLRGALAHRYRFEGTGETLSDDRGNAAGTIRNTALTGDGSLALAGGTSNQYADLPDGLISGFTSVTVEAWVTWTGTESWQRVFDFGDNNSGIEGESGAGQTYLMLSPRVDDKALGAAFANAGPESAVFVQGTEALPAGTVQHVAVVLDDSNDQLRLYLNGRLVGTSLVTGSLAEIRDTSNWLGRSQYKTDGHFSGALHELRIYGGALSDAQLMLSFSSGTDPDFLAD